jgi:hypothetical protein
MADNPATATDLVNRSLRTLTSRETEVGAVLLGDAWSMLVAARPSVESRLEVQPPVPAFRALVVQILCAMVLRVLNNPDGKLEEQGDDYRYRLDSAVSTGALYLSDAELGRISDGDGISDGAFTIKPAGIGVGPGYWSDTTTWVPLA